MWCELVSSDDSDGREELRDRLRRLAARLRRFAGVADRAEDDAVSREAD